MPLLRIIGMENGLLVPEKQIQKLESRLVMFVYDLASVSKVVGVGTVLTFMASRGIRYRKSVTEFT